MKRIVIFLVVVYVFSLFSAWGLFLKNTNTNAILAENLEATKNELITTKTALETEKTAHADLKKKIVDARTNATFLALALCPTLETNNKNALCIKNSPEWLSQTIEAGTLLSDTSSKTKMDALLVAISAKKKPTARQLYEMLRPVEVNSLQALTENLK